jgi:hypothetical protein
VATLPDEVRDRVRSYIVHQAAKEPAAIKDIVQHGHDQLLDRIDGLSEEQARFKPGPDDWSVLEVLQHAAPAKRWLAGICAALARGETPARSEGDAAPPASLAEARSALQSAHQELLGFIDGLSPEADLEARHEHLFFGPLNCREWATFQLVHDRDHAQQIDQIKAAPGFPAA